MGYKMSGRLLSACRETKHLSTFTGTEQVVALRTPSYGEAQNKVW